MHLFSLFCLSLFLQYLIIAVSEKTLFCIDRVKDRKPQNFHTVPTSRAGGLGIFIVSVIGLGFMGKTGLLILISSLPVFIVGLYEDINSNLSPRLRLYVMASSACLAILLLDSIVFDLGIFRLSIWFAIPFTILAIAGVSSAINIIDGFHGLASGVSIIILMSFAAASYVAADQLILNITTVLIVIMTGFFVWNFPKGRIFLGDGGAYFIGFLLAIISVLLVKRNPVISPWFPLIALSYPIFEVFFSIYRKSVRRGMSAFMPDRVHLHMLIYKRITRSHAKTSAYIWTIVAVFNFTAVIFQSNTTVLIFAFFLFAVFYLYLYRKTVRFGNSIPDRLAILAKTRNTN